MATTTAATEPRKAIAMNENEINEVKALHEATLEELAELKKAYMKKVNAEGQALVHREFAAFFAANPDVKAVVWNQYTPYFNDGEACEFGVHDFYGSHKELTDEGVKKLPTYVEEEEGFESGYNYHYYSAEGQGRDSKYFEGAGYPLDQEKYALLKRVDDAVDTIARRLRPHDDLLEIAFGDHAQVIATARGFKVKHIDHD